MSNPIKHDEGFGERVPRVAQVKVKLHKSGEDGDPFYDIKLIVNEKKEDFNYLVKLTFSDENVYDIPGVVTPMLSYPSANKTCVEYKKVMSTYEFPPTPSEGGVVTVLLNYSTTIIPTGGPSEEWEGVEYINESSY